MDITGLKFSSSSSYTIIDVIGRGGMGIVFLAEKDCEGVIDTVALKTIRNPSEDMLAKLRGEANIATGLRHENVVKTYGLEAIPYSHLPPELVTELDNVTAESHKKGTMVLPAKVRARPIINPRYVQKQAARDDRKLYLMVMDYIEGTDIGALHRSHMKQQLLMPCMLSAFIISRVCRALAYAHDFLIHRDISPENLLLNTQGVVKLSDFGIAVSEHDTTTMLAGKFLYMSPEQLRREPLDARTDLFSLGLVLYDLLTGISPHRMPPGLTQAQQEEVLAGLFSKEIPAPAVIRPDVPPILSDICMKMLQKKRENRYPRAIDVANHLEQKYLYAQGFGPTNNALQAYLEIYASGFHESTNDQLKQLGFLKDADGAFALKRHVTAAAYSKLGRAWIALLSAAHTKG